MSFSPPFGERGSFGASGVLSFLAVFFEAVAGLRDFLVALDFNLGFFGFFGFFALSFAVITHPSEILLSLSMAHQRKMFLHLPMNFITSGIDPGILQARKGQKG